MADDRQPAPDEEKPPRGDPSGPASSEWPLPHNVFPMAVLVEGGMGLLAIALGWLLSRPPASTFRWELRDALWGLVATMPLVALLAICVYVPFRPLRDILHVIDQWVVPLFRPCSLGEMAVIAVLAGFGEEMLFRGVIQNALGGWLGGTTGLWAACGLASLLFGFAHAVSPAYAVLAALIGLYLGTLWIVTANLLVPVVAHGVYDFVALVYLVRLRGKRTS